MTLRTSLFGWTVSFGLVASAAWAQIESIEGSASWDGSDPVPRGSTMVVDLVDLTREGDGTVLSSMRFKPDSSLPLPFTLHYDSDLVTRGQRYSLIARMERGDEVLYRSRVAVPVLRTFQNDTPQITLHKVVPVVASGTPVGYTWGANAIGGEPVLPYTQIHITFDEDSTVRGSFGCNTFRTTYVIDGEKLEFRRFKATKQGCQTPTAKQERAVRAALRRSATYQRMGDTLIFLDVAGLETLSFQRQ